jgi:2-phospho-L-lactate guanylyltransferase
MRFAVVPMKPLALAKTRLAPVLAPADRIALSAAMFHDVLEALVGAREIDAVAVVTAEKRLLELARRLGMLPIDEGSPQGLNGAVALGTDTCCRHGATSVLVVLSDLPLVTSAEIDALYRDLPDGDHVRLVRSHEGLGTNALLRQPPRVIPTRFGGRSFHGHVTAAAAAGVSWSQRELPGLSFDVDTVDDLRELALAPRPNRTSAEARRLGLGDPRFS